MRMRRLLVLSVALGLAAALTLPPGAFAHELVEDNIRFDGNYLSAGARTTGPLDSIGPVDSIHVDIHDGRLSAGKGKPSSGSLVNAYASTFRWGPLEDGACWVESERWTSQSAVFEPGTGAWFNTPYDGGMSITLMLHGQRFEYEGMLHAENGETWCHIEGEPAQVIDLGRLVPFAADAAWTSEVEFKGKKPSKIRTTIEFSRVTFDNVVLTVLQDPDHPSPYACSMPHKFSVGTYRFIDNH